MESLLTQQMTLNSGTKKTKPTNGAGVSGTSRKERKHSSSEDESSSVVVDESKNQLSSPPAASINAPVSSESFQVKRSEYLFKRYMQRADIYIYIAGKDSAHLFLNITAEKKLERRVHGPGRCDHSDNSRRPRGPARRRQWPKKITFVSTDRPPDAQPHGRDHSRS